MSPTEIEFPKLGPETDYSYEGIIVLLASLTTPLDCWAFPSPRLSLQGEQRAASGLERLNIFSNEIHCKKYFNFPFVHDLFEAHILCEREELS